MKDFFKFNKPKDSYEFQIKEPELPIAPKYNKSENISADLNFILFFFEHTVPKVVSSCNL